MDVLEVYNTAKALIKKIRSESGPFIWNARPTDIAAIHAEPVLDELQSDEEINLYKAKIQ